MRNVKYVGVISRAYCIVLRLTLAEFVTLEQGLMLTIKVFLFP